MAVYKIFPYKDTTLYTLYPDMNTGIDPILQISNLNIAMDSFPFVSRFLVQFPQNEISDIINNKIKSSKWDVSFKSFIATAEGIVEETEIEIYPVAEDWFNGTGTYLDSPQTTDGCNWFSPYFKGGIDWDDGSLTPTDPYGNRITGSYNPNYIAGGGGSWLYSSGSISFKSTQSFDVRSVKDIDIPVKEVVSRWYSGSMDNNGFIIKWEDAVEWNTSIQVQPVMQFYSVDTNTIYPPELQFKWKDYSTVLTGSATGSIVNTTNLVSSLAENPGYFTPQSVNRFRFNVAPKYPVRVWTTASQFTGTNYLPTSSCYAIKDLDTNEFVVDFDDTYTQLSSDSEGNYFDVYMNGLEPERYYKICIKTHINGSTLILDDKYYFKVVNAL